MGEPLMTVYAVGQLKFTDRAAYERYAARFRGVLKQFGGRLLAADEQPEIIEGRWDRDKIVLLSFLNATAFHGFFESAQYREIAKDRKAGADTLLLLVHGIDDGGS
jgi:uncharacterized protein (DUF1330 family)